MKRGKAERRGWYAMAALAGMVILATLGSLFLGARAYSQCVAEAQKDGAELLKKSLNHFPVNSVECMHEKDDCEYGTGGDVSLGVSAESPEGALKGFYLDGWSRVPVGGELCDGRIGCVAQATKSLRDKVISVTVTHRGNGLMYVELMYV